MMAVLLESRLARKKVAQMADCWASRTEKKLAGQWVDSMAVRLAVLKADGKAGQSEPLSV